jgi:hypothetical protein
MLQCLLLEAAVHLGGLALAAATTPAAAVLLGALGLQWARQQQQQLIQALLTALAQGLCTCLSNQTGCRSW